MCLKCDFLFFLFFRDLNMIEPRELKELLKCPVCFGFPKKETNTVGICVNGHLTCDVCANAILKRRNAHCPECRNSNFQLVRGHKLTVSIINLIAQHELYACQYPNCQENVPGDEIDRHKKLCRHKPLECPKKSCIYKGPLSVFVSGQHYCLDICEMNESTKSWNFTLEIKDIYSMDAHQIKILPYFKPKLLVGFGNRGTDFINKTFISVAQSSDTVAIYPGWMDKKVDVCDESIKMLKIDIFGYINTQSGVIGQSTTTNLKFIGENVTLNDGVFYLAKHTLWSWTEWSNQYQCHECSNRTKKRPHIHLKVSFQN